ncbi:MAG: ATP-binding protein [Candidatus Hodarchaeales archaeon]
MTVLGKLVASRDLPSSPGEFYFWLSGEHPSIEVGNIVVSKSDDQTTFGLVTDMRFYTDAESALSDFFSHDFGDPKAVPPTKRSQIYVAKAEIIRQDPEYSRPPSSGIITLANADEVRKAYRMDDIDDPLLMGLLSNGPDVIAPVTVSQKYVLGPEGAHINLCGASGLATKTSAAMFLVSSILAQWQQKRCRVAAVTFNLKSEDLLFLERNQECSNELINNSSPREKKYHQIIDDFNIPPYIPTSNIQYFAPARKFDPQNPDSLRTKDINTFCWTFEDIANRERSIRLIHMLDPDDIDERSYGVLALIESMATSGQLSDDHDIDTFKDLVEFLGRVHTLPDFESRTSTWKGHHIATIQKVKKLIDTTAQFQLRGLFSYDSNVGKDIELQNLDPGDLWVIDIQSLSDKGKRIVFLNVIGRIAQILEEEKIKDESERKFDAIVVFVDELNKFAPRAYGGKSSSLKSEIVDIAARGRSIGLILIGAEQFASGIDREIYGNTSTHLVGRTEYSELSESVYRWISGDLKTLVSHLPKGMLLLKHAVFPRPLPVRFPRPLFTYTKNEVQQLCDQRRIKGKVIRTRSEYEDKILEQIYVLSKQKKVNPNTIYNRSSEIKKMGISLNKYQKWCNKWCSQKKYEGRTNQERKAVEITINFLKT